MMSSLTPVKVSGHDVDHAIEAEQHLRNSVKTETLRKLPNLLAAGRCSRHYQQTQSLKNFLSSR